MKRDNFADLIHLLAFSTATKNPVEEKADRMEKGKGGIVFLRGEL